MVLQNGVMGREGGADAVEDLDRDFFGAFLNEGECTVSLSIFFQTCVGQLTPGGGPPRSSPSSLGYCRSCNLRRSCTTCESV